MTVREVARKENISHVAVMKRRDKTLTKLRKFYINAVTKLPSPLASE